MQLILEGEQIRNYQLSGIKQAVSYQAQAAGRRPASNSCKIYFREKQENKPEGR